MNEKNKRRLEWVYGTVGIIGALATVPQAVKVWTTHPEHVEGLSFITWFAYGLIGVLAVVYGVVFERKALVITNSVYVILYLLILTGMLVESESIW